MRHAKHYDEAKRSGHRPPPSVACKAATFLQCETRRSFVLAACLFPEPPGCRRKANRTWLVKMRWKMRSLTRSSPLKDEAGLGHRYHADLQSVTGQIQNTPQMMCEL